MKCGKGSEKVALFVTYINERKSEVLMQREHLCSALNDCNMETTRRGSWADWNNNTKAGRKKVFGHAL